jgi:tyrosinase
MHVDIALDATDPATGQSFLTWCPIKGHARLTDASGAQVPVSVTLRNGGTSGGGQVVFDLQRTDSGNPQLALQLPLDGSPVEFWVAGEYQHPSTAYGDAAIEAVDGTGASVGRRDLMLRIRKNAVSLTNAERDLFLTALGKLNNAGKGPFQSFRDTHVGPAYYEAHGLPGFPPWHRAYLLDLERELQLIDASVVLPYWRFDQPTPTLFAQDFLGMPPANPQQGNVIQFPHGHALEFWKTDGNDPIERRPRYNINGAPPANPQAGTGVISQQDTLNLGTTYMDFRQYEDAPHGYAHTSFQGPINTVPTAAKDPLFFLLHGNIDRLWAFWQWLNLRNDPASPDSYSLSGAQWPVNRANGIGHNLSDTLWPWNQSATPPRPTFPPPRGPMPASPITSAPGGAPRIQDVIDYQGVHGGQPLGFDYDDVPFELPPGGPVS